MQRKYVETGMSAGRIRLIAGADIAADTAVAVVDGVATASALGAYETIGPVKAGQVFYANYSGSAGGGGAAIADGQSVSVVNNSGTAPHAATATVTGSTLTNVKLPATAAMVDNAATVGVTNSAGSGPRNGTMIVNAGILTSVRLPAATAMMDSGGTLTGVAPTGTYTNTVTFTVANGVITGIALS